MTVSDYIFSFLTSKGVDTLFMITGGQAMFLNDAVYRNKKLNYICGHHEQALGMSADAYGRITGKLGVTLVTAGPAAINVMNGVVGGWVDSSPMMVISGQSALSYVQYQQKTKIRQYGIQGINIKPLVEKVTKYFVTVDDPSMIQYYMQKAYYLALNGRPGPVWIEVPLDIQRMEVPKKLLKEFLPEDDHEVTAELTASVKKTIGLLLKSKHPILFVGQGIRLAGAMDEFNKVVKKLQIPIITSRLGIDLINSDNELYVGRPGTYGERAAHFAIQNSDLILVVGSRLSSSTVGHNSKEFGKNAKKIVVDIDIEELEKPSVDIFLKINADIKLFLSEFLKLSKSYKVPNYKNWIKKCNFWKKKYPVVLPEYKKEKPINSYYFTEKLSQLASEKDMILVDTGSCFHVACQTWKIKKNQRFLTTGGISSMGYWAAGIGACLANNRKNTIVITGDGSLQFNIQEFATIKYNNLPIKVFIFNNNGYLLIRHTQKNFMNGRLMGESEKNGVWCPDSLKIASAYGIKGVRINSIDEIDKKVREVLNYKGPVICDVMTPEWQLLIPRTASEKRPDGTLVAKPYEDMFPFLDRDEFKKVNQA
ncbi:MAG: thiamine pyrophosphate-binding protein [Patescibacteria group bacterium]|jgi:acetolactate synthase-1/2/3 large subunit